MGASENLRQRIEALNRAPLPPAASTAEVDAVRRQLRRGHDAPSHRAPAVYSRAVLQARERLRPASDDSFDAPAAAAVALEDALAGAEVVGEDGARYYLVETRVDHPAELPSHDGSPGAGDGVQVAERSRLHERYASVWHRPEWMMLRRMACNGRPLDISAPEVLLVDLETTGLDCSPLFLVGILESDGKGLVVRQYLARDYSEERAVIAAFARCMAGKKLLVSFNGKSFDVPYLRLRARVTGVDLHVSVPHLDVLHEARRAWRRMVPNCKLQTLETLICGRARHGDIPGGQIPAAYHAFVRTKNAARLASIVEHNRMDLVTLAELMVRLPDAPP